MKKCNLFSLSTYDLLLKKAGAWLSVKRNKAYMYVSYLALNMLSFPLMTSASGAEAGEVDSDAMWNLVMEFIIKWIPRLGGVLLFIGGVEFAIAYKNEDANGKTNAVRLMVSGAMVIAIPKALGNLIRI